MADTVSMEEHMTQMNKDRDNQTEFIIHKDILWHLLLNHMGEKLLNF